MQYKNKRERDEMDPNLSLDNNEVIVSINNKPLEEIKATNKWGKNLLLIPRHKLSRGFNTLSLEWPTLKQIEHMEIQNLTARYAMGLKVDLFPVFGELFKIDPQYPNATNKSKAACF